MTYNDVKETIIERIEKEKTDIIDRINKASQCEDWEEIRDKIDFIIQAHGAIMMIDRVKEAGDEFDKEEAQTSKA